MTSQIKTHALSKGKKAVVLIGGAHLPKKRSRKALSLSQRLNKEGASVYAVQVLAGLPPKVKQQYQAQLNEIPAMSFLDLNEHWLGELAAPVRPGTKPSELLKRKDSYDAIVFLGPLKELMYQTGTKENLSDDVWWQELNRRSQIRFGHPLQEKSKNSSRLEPVAWR